MLPLEHSAILSTFIKLPFIIEIIVLSMFEWPFYVQLIKISIVELVSEAVEAELSITYSQKHNTVFLLLPIYHDIYSIFFVFG